MNASAMSLAMMIVLATGGSLTPAWAADRAAQVKQCVTDNQAENQSSETILSYCSCMADKMPGSESSSITEWESNHKSDMDACAAGAHWKDQ